ncbi:MULTISPECIES: Na+/H+ antiporter subunit E [Marivita]|uniref:Na+/H+ antiporter subunit E n=1 Tax=Marivita cryptomonadis TaxID=505252 RepID=A0A9Q2NZH7_9RHOB|nr:MULTISPECIES: Na+/H+ antiporter subunit E [Marivita]MCR9167014.1 Na+/H+ antiporter subunit E [Paracoccaceae bacterium]MBM2319892.1 Na+/H+ antiporter subunit E [Marivita cryptomonadis]MBM2329471.1 Na+/H+ antiporter subunit E [Marivita cryptomonadis]MBM2339059.1 Na+/H+ antiporter subunit E [Marivita cryptomonadis]MBM2343717.1 Na+/H+ antiporter subunit E [Marivita cryptomonadis]
MNTFGLNIILAIAWVAFTGSVSLIGLITGFVIGYGALWLIQPLIGTSSYFKRVAAWIKLVIMFHYELIVSSIAVAIDVLTPRHRSRPAIIEVPLDVKTDTGILLVTNLISLTPGTLSLDVSEDRKTLLVHAMFADDPDALRKSLKDGMERWVIDAVEGA